MLTVGHDNGAGLSSARNVDYALICASLGYKPLYGSGLRGSNCNDSLYTDCIAKSNVYKFHTFTTSQAFLLKVLDLLTDLFKQILYLHHTLGESDVGHL